MPNVLLGRLAGSKVAQMESLEDEEIALSCSQIFDKFLPERKRGKIVGVKTSKWKTNENFNGTYSYHTEENPSVDEIATPICGSDGKPRVQFAGEATHPYFFSTVHGAIETGVREANRLIEIYSK